MDYEEEQEALAAEEAAAIGGRPDDVDLDRDDRPADDRPAGVSREAYRAVDEAGGGVAEGFEEAEAALIDRAESRRGPSPLTHRGEHDEDPAALDATYGEADHVETSEDDPDRPTDA